MFSSGHLHKCLQIRIVLLKLLSWLSPLTVLCLTQHSCCLMGRKLSFFWRAISWDILSGYSHQYSIFKQISGSWNHMKRSWSEGSRTSTLILKCLVIFCLLHYLLFLNITLIRLQNAASVGNHQLCWVQRGFCKEGKCTEIPVLMLVVCCSFPRSIGKKSFVPETSSI